MYEHYLKIFYRNSKKNKLSIVINLLSISIGMAVCLFILHYVVYERSFDSFHGNGENLYRLELTVYKNGVWHSQREKSVCALGPAMKVEFPEVLEFARLHGNSGGIVSFGDKYSAKQKGLFLADNSFIKMLPLHLIRGNPDNALAEPYSAIISESEARRAFGGDDPIGKIIDYDRIYHLRYTIKGVFKDMPVNSHLQFNYLFSIHRIVNLRGFKDNWDSHNFFTYILLDAKADPRALQAKMPKFLDKYIGEKSRRDNTREVYSLQPVKDIYLHSYDQGVDIRHGNIKVVNFLLIIALFIIIIAWVNYINLATARSLDRAKEVGFRKVVGAGRIQLIKQFLFESLFLNICGTAAAIIVFIILKSGFNRFVNIPQSVSLLSEVNFWLILLVFLIIGSFLAGLYPAFFISSYKPVNVIQGKLKGSSGGIVLRKSLVVFQLAASVILIAGTFIVFRQVSFMQEQDLGINTEQVLVIDAPLVVARTRNINYNIRAFFRDVLQYSEIDNATMGVSIPGMGFISSDEFRRPGRPGSLLKRCWVDTGYLGTFQIKVIAGRDFNPRIFSDYTEAAILNEAAVNVLGFESPGKVIDQIVSYGSAGSKLKIIGVVKNYNHVSLKHAIEPVIYQYSQHYGPSHYSMKLKTKNLSKTIAFVKGKWEELLPGNPFNYHFLDDLLKQQYISDTQFGRIFGLFALLAIFISCIGIFGLSAHSTLQRTKEIGVRKVFGADVSRILALLLKDFIRLLIYSMLVAFPIAYFVFSNWLENYAYRIEIGVWFFAIPMLVLTPIVLFTVAYHVIKAALGNPVESLRYE